MKKIATKSQTLDEPVSINPPGLSTEADQPHPVHSLTLQIGIDWADEGHAYHCVAPDGKVIAGVLDQDPQAIADWIAQWRKRFSGCQIEICLETSRGALINSLLEHRNATISKSGCDVAIRFLMSAIESPVKDRIAAMIDTGQEVSAYRNRKMVIADCHEGRTLGFSGRARVSNHCQNAFSPAPLQPFVIQFVDVIWGSSLPSLSLVQTLARKRSVPVELEKYRVWLSCGTTALTTRREKTLPYCTHSQPPLWSNAVFGDLNGYLRSTGRMIDFFRVPDSALRLEPCKT